ncbi:MAG: AraC family transcriptional regulator ligand-binding domain-containing protein [Myxococcota bacterium]
MAPPTYSFGPGWRLLFQDMGVDVERVFRRAQMPLGLLARKSGRIPAEQYHALWMGLEEEVGRDVLAVRMAESITAEAFSPTLFAGLCSDNLNHAAVRLAEHKLLIGPIRLQVSIDAERTTLTLGWIDHVMPPDSFAEVELLFWVAFARLATREPVNALHMTMPRTGGDVDAITRFAGTMPAIGSTWSVSFTAADAVRPFLTANTGMWEFFEPELRRRLAQLQAGIAVSERVRAALMELLPTGDASAETVARKLAMSKRTMQRRLRGEDVSFQEILNQTRESLARHYLRHSEMPAAEISFLLGYEDPNSFYRAFHAWTGQTPESLRLT